MSTTYLGMTVFDTPDPVGLARFWSAMLGWEVDPSTSADDWVTLRKEGQTPLGFQLAPALTRATWPQGDVPQQAHLDVYVSDLEAALARALALGATPLTPETDEPNLRVLADPSGHPFCLCLIGE
jgi:predicted enzyme related to lactoylglutathione lyase